MQSILRLCYVVFELCWMAWMSAEMRQRTEDVVDPISANKNFGKPKVTVVLSWSTDSDTGKHWADLVCWVSSGAYSSLRWQRADGRLLHGDEHFTLYTIKNGAFKLRIIKVDKGIFGNYTCHAANRFGTDSADIEVSSVPLKSRIQSDKRLHAKQHTVTISTIAPLPVREFQVFLNKAENLSNIQNVTLTVGRRNENGWYQVTHTFKKLKPSETYKGYVLAMNEYGVGPRTEFVFSTAPE